jgi:hypothetical protein
MYIIWRLIMYKTIKSLFLTTLGITVSVQSMNINWEAIQQKAKKIAPYAGYIGGTVALSYIFYQTYKTYNARSASTHQTEQTKTEEEKIENSVLEIAHTIKTPTQNPKQIKSTLNLLDSKELLNAIQQRLNGNTNGTVIDNSVKKSIEVIAELIDQKNATAVNALEKHLQELDPATRLKVLQYKNQILLQKAQETPAITTIEKFYREAGLKTK